MALADCRGVQHDEHRSGRADAALAGLIVLAALSSPACNRCSATEHGSALTRVEQVRRLEAHEVRHSHPVRLTGVVTYHNPVSKLSVIQDSTGGIPVDVSRADSSLLPGQLVRLEGFAEPGDCMPVIVQPRVTQLGTGRTPEPRSVSWKDLASGREDYQWVEARGIVRSAKVEHDGHLSLDVATNGGRFNASVLEYGGVEFSSIVDASVRIRGVASTVFSVRKELIRVQLLVPGRDNISVEEPVPADPFSVPVRPIQGLSRLTPQDVPGHRVRVQGVVAEQKPGEAVVLVDGADRIRLRPAHMIPVRPGDHVDVLGLPATEAGAVILEEALLRRVDAGGRVALPASGATGRGSSPLPPSVLTNVQQVRGLTPEEADRGYPVRLRAVVTYYDPAWAIMFVQDSSGGIYVDANGEKEFDVTAGQLVEVEGVSDAGDFAPQIVNPRVRARGPGAMPPARRVPLQRLFTGQFDSQWVEADGIVQSVKIEEQHLWLTVASGLYRFQVHSADLSHRDLLPRLVDSRVRVRGACGTLFNQKRQLVGVEIYVPDLTYVSLKEPGVADPFSTPVRPASTLLLFSPREDVGHRVRVQGVVTLRRHGDLFVKDESGAVLVHFVPTEEAARIRVGDQVDVVGFPAPGEYTPVLEHAVLRKAGSSALPAPALVTAEEALRGNYDAQLVRIEAHLLDRVVHATEQVLTLRAGKLVFAAHLEDGGAGDSLAGLRDGSLVQLTGVCAVHVDSSRSPRIPRSFRILLRSAGDVVVLEKAPWWTLRHALGAASLMVAGLCAALAWVTVLTRRVNSQTEAIRARFRREAALEQRYGDLFENANDVIYSHDLQGNLTSFNKAAERATGYGREEALNTSILRLLAPGHSELVPRMIASHRAGERVPVQEVELATKDGRRITLEINSRLLYEDGEPSGLECIGRDVTERKQFEEQLRQALKIEAVGRLAGGVAHDFNNILNVVMGYGEMLLRQLAPEARLRPKAEQILKAAQRGAALTHQLLAFSRKQVLEPKILDLNFVVADMEKMLARLIGEDVRLVAYPAPGLGAVKADPGQIEQVILNLAVNARDAMPEGGTLAIETANVDLDERYVRSHRGSRPGPHVMIAVSDTGTGMDPETMSRAFEPFFTTKERGKGTGLGLATVYGIVKQSEGYISLKSAPGRGTRFEIYLPRVDDVADASGPAVEEEDYSGSETILLVEDDDMVRGATLEMLEAAGYTVLAARGGVEAIEVSQRYPGPIQVVVTDVIMPQMNGPELARRLMPLRPEAQVLYVSGYTEDALAHAQLQALGAFLSKPLTSAALCRKVRALLERGGIGSEGGARETSPSPS